MAKFAAFILCDLLAAENGGDWFEGASMMHVDSLDHLAVEHSLGISADTQRLDVLQQSISQIEKVGEEVKNDPKLNRDAVMKLLDGIEVLVGQVRADINKSHVFAMAALKDLGSGFQSCLDDATALWPEIHESGAPLSHEAAAALRAMTDHSDCREVEVGDNGVAGAIEVGGHCDVFHKALAAADEAFASPLAVPSLTTFFKAFDPDDFHAKAESCERTVSAYNKKVPECKELQKVFEKATCHFHSRVIDVRNSCTKIEKCRDGDGKSLTDRCAEYRGLAVAWNAEEVACDQITCMITKLKNSEYDLSSCKVPTEGTSEWNVTCPVVADSSLEENRCFTYTSPEDDVQLVPGAESWVATKYETKAWWSKARNDVASADRISSLVECELPDEHHASDEATSDGGSSGDSPLVTEGTLSVSRDNTCYIGTDNKVKCFGPEILSELTPETRKSLYEVGKAGLPAQFIGGSWTWGTKLAIVLPDGSIRGEGLVARSPNWKTLITEYEGKTFTKYWPSSYESACGQTTEGELLCWGYRGGNKNHFLGKTSGCEPIKVSDMSVQYMNICAIKEEDQSLFCFRADRWECPFDKSQPQKEVFQPPTGKFRSISCPRPESNSKVCCALKIDDSQTVCWNRGGVLAPGVEHWDSYKHFAPPSTAFQSIAIGLAFGCGIKNNGELQCWGKDDEGVISGVPNGKASEVACGAYHCCAIIEKKVTCWGAKLNRQRQERDPTGLLTNPHNVQPLGR